MCEEFTAAFGGSRATHKSPVGSSSRADSEPAMRHGYDPNGRHHVQPHQRSQPTYEKMHDYLSTDNETGYNQQREYKSPLAPSSSRGHASRQSHEDSRDQYDVNDAPDYGRSSGAAAATESAEVPAIGAAISNTWNIADEKGMHAHLSVHFSGSPTQFAQGVAQTAPGSASNVPVSATNAPRKRENAAVQGTESVDFVPTKFHFSGQDLQRDLRAPDRAKMLADGSEGKQIAQMVERNKQILPLGVTVEDYHNPFSFPLGLRASHEPLNTVHFGNSPQKYMTVLMPGGTHRSDKTIDLRSTVNVHNMRVAAVLSNEDIGRQCKPSGNRAPGVVMIERDSMLHTAIEKYHKMGRIEPIDWSAVKTLETHGGSFLDGIPVAAAEYAIDQLKTIQRSKNGKVAVDDVSFTVHPLNFMGSWSKHHLSGASYDKDNNSVAYEDFMNRPVDVVVNMKLEYL